MRTLYLGVAFWAMSLTAAGAFCPAPGAAPKPPQSFDRPSPPACLANARGGANDCDARDLDRYSDEVAAYIKKLDDYVFAAERYARDAAKYAACEADEARESLGQ